MHCVKNTWKRDLQSIHENEIGELYMVTRLTKYTRKQDYIYNTGNDILELYNVLAQVRLATSKVNLISTIKNLVYELSHDVRLSIFGN